MAKSLIAPAVALGVLCACVTDSEAGEGSESLAGTSWRLAELQAIGDAIGVVRPDDPSKYEMNLAADGSASFRLDCNRATGSWSSPDADRAVGGITFSPLAMTRAFCPESLDTRVAGELGAVRHFSRVGDQLIFEMETGGGRQVWRRHSE